MLMKRNIRVLIVNGALASLFAACSADAPMEMVQDDGRVEIRVNSSISSSVEPATRAVLDGMINSDFGTDLDVAFARADAGAGGNYTTYRTAALNGTAAAASKTLSFSPAEYYPADGSKTKLIGWYPRRSGVSFTQNTRVVDFGIVDGKTDIMATPLKEGDKNANVASLVFSHLLTQISVKVYAPDENARDLWGTVNSVKIAGKKQKCTITLPEATAADGATVAAPAFTDTDDLDLVKSRPDNVSTVITYPLTMGTGSADDAVAAGYAMFAPQASGKITLNIGLSVGGAQTAEVSAPADGGFKAGVSYAVTLKFTSAGITPEVSVADWITGTPITDIEI